MEKKLYRSNSNKIISGVCGGLGEYFSIDPTIIRIAYVFFCFLGGSGVLLYLICLLLMPEDKPYN